METRSTVLQESRRFSNLFRLIFGLTLLALMSGCKVVIDVKKGGTVNLDWGPVVCPSETVCEVDITDVYFDVRYVAVPDPGYTFSHWRRRFAGLNGPLCGNLLGPENDCAVRTTGLQGNPDAQDILDSDLTFFLEPVFIKEDLSNRRLGWPLESAPRDTRITQPYACFDCINNEKYHIGVDMKFCNLNAKSGNDCTTDGNVLAVQAGKICRVIENGIEDSGFGNTVIIDHENGLFSMYSHLLNPPSFGSEYLCANRDEPGQAGELCIREGEKIGEVGGSGYGDPTYWEEHLHFGLIPNCELPVDPGYSSAHPSIAGYGDPWPLFRTNIMNEPVIVEGLREPLLGARLGPSLSSKFLNQDILMGQQFVSRAETDEWILIDLPCGNESGPDESDKACSGWVQLESNNCTGAGKQCVERTNSSFVVEVPFNRNHVTVYKEPGGVTGTLSSVKLWRGMRTYFTGSAGVSQSGTGVTCDSGQWREIDIPSEAHLPVGTDKLAQTYGWVCLDHITAEVPAEPFAHFSLDGNGADVSGNGFDANTIIGTTATLDRFGNSGAALTFDGDDYIVTGLDMADEFDVGAPLTISFWFRSTSTLTAMVAGTQPGSGPSFSGSLDSQGFVGVRLYSGTPAISDLPMNDGHWHHVVYGTNGSLSTFFYIDGISQGARPTVGTNSQDVILLGAVRENGSFFSGALDDVRIYDQGLSEAQILDLYQSSIAD